MGCVSDVWDTVTGENAEESQEQAEAATNALTKISRQEWAHYRDTYKPLLTGLVDKSQKDEYSGRIEGSIAGAAKQNQASTDAAITAIGAQRGLDPSQQAVSSAMAKNAGTTGALTGQSLASVRPAMDDAKWANQVGLVQVGKGLPGEVASGYSNLANQYATTAANEAAKSSQLLGGIGSLTGLGLGLAL